MEIGIFVLREVLPSFFNVGILGSSCPQFKRQVEENRVDLMQN